MGDNSASTSQGWLRNLYTQSGPPESLRPPQQGPDWVANRAASENPADWKGWEPRTPPQLVVSIIGQLLKLLPDSPEPSINSKECSVSKIGTPSSESTVPTLAHEPLTSIPRSGGAAVHAQPFQHALPAPSYKPTHAEEAVSRQIQPSPNAGLQGALRIGYAKYPSVFINQSEDFQPVVQVRKSSHPAVHIYSRVPIQIDDKFDAMVKQHAGTSLDPLPGDASRNEEAEEEGLINPYIRQKQPTIFFHTDAHIAGSPLAPRICIDTTSLWWPAIQCTSCNSRQAGGVSALGNFGEGNSCIAIMGPVKPLSMDLPY